jgi:hypothetical protein
MTASLSSIALDCNHRKQGKDTLTKISECPSSRQNDPVDMKNTYKYDSSKCGQHMKMSQYSGK